MVKQDIDVSDLCHLTGTSPDRVWLSSGNIEVVPASAEVELEVEVEPVVSEEESEIVSCVLSEDLIQSKTL